MSYHIVNIDSPNCSLSCRDGQLTCKADGETRSVPLEDVAAIVVTSFSANIHSKLLLEAAKQGVGFILCEQFKPASLVLPANRATDTLLARAQVNLPKKQKAALWEKTVTAKVRNQYALAKALAPAHGSLSILERLSRGRRADREATAARVFWRIFGEAVGLKDDFRRGRREGTLNPLLNYGYAVLLTTVLQKCFAFGIDPTFGIHHEIRERSTPLAYDLMEPFRPCVDWRVAQWVKKHPTPESWQVDREYRKWVTGFPLVETDYLDLTLELRGCIEGVVQSFRTAVVSKKTGAYKPWIQGSSRWAG